MITSFELKNRPCCRAFYKIPYFVKNLIILVLMAAVMVPTYIFNQRAGDLSVRTVYRMIAGLNSHTFEYIHTKQQGLMITPSIKSINMQRISPVNFYSTCVTVNRPCLIQGMAKTWPAYERWSYHAFKDSKNYYLLDKLGKDFKTSAFIDREALTDF
jgi:hypothetical protein